MSIPASTSPAASPDGAAGTGPVAPAEPAGTATPSAAPPTAPAAVVGEASGVPDDAEISRLRAEVATLRNQLDRRSAKRPATRAIRGVIAAILVVLAAFALVGSVVGLWAARTTLNTDRWVATVAPLPQDPRVNAAVTEYATTEIFRLVDVEQRLREVLPPQAAFAAGPIAGQLREQVHKIVGNVLASDRFQVIWVQLNQQLHQRAMAVLNGESTVVTADGDKVRIDLLPLINQVLRQLSAELPTLFGKQITLPDLSSGAIPENLRLRVEEATGVALPADFAQFTVYDSGRLTAAQQAVATAKRDLAIFVALTVVLLIAAFVVSPRRRRTAFQLGVWLVIAAVAVTAIVRAVRRQLLGEVPEGVYRDGVDSAVTTVFSLLRERGVQLIVIGLVIAVVAYLAGPGRGAVWLRRGVRRGAVAGWRGAGVVTARVPGFVTRNRDAVRIGGVVLAALLALILSSWTSLLVIVVLLAAFEIAVTVAARDATDPPPPAHPA